MADRLLFTVQGKTPVVAKEITLAEAGLKEREDVEEWVIAQPALIGPDVLIVTSEFAGWASKKGDRDLDRLDVLALAADGRLVLAELKRDKAPTTVGMQVLNYAARANLFTVEKLAVVHQKFLKSRGTTVTVDEARALLEHHAAELSDETLGDVPRLVLLATDFGLDVTTTAVFLTRKLGVDIQLVQLQAYRTASNDLIVSVSRIFPPQDMDDIVLGPQAEQEQEKKLEKTREKNTVARILAAEAIPEGTVLRLQPGNEMSATAKKTVLAWVGEDEKRGQATWQLSTSAPLVWAVDGHAYSPTGLVRHLASQAGVEIDSIAGPRSWRDGKGLTLPEIAAKADG